MIKLALGSTNWLLARFNEADGDDVTATNPGTPAVTVALANPAGATVLSATAMSWDATFIAPDENGVSRTGWWKVLAAASVFATRGRHRMTVTGTSGGTTRVLYRNVTVEEI